MACDIGAASAMLRPLRLERTPGKILMLSFVKEATIVGAFSEAVALDQSRLEFSHGVPECGKVGANPLSSRCTHLPHQPRCFSRSCPNVQPPHRVIRLELESGAEIVETAVKAVGRGFRVFRTDNASVRVSARVGIEQVSTPKARVVALRTGSFIGV